MNKTTLFKKNLNLRIKTELEADSTLLYTVCFLVSVLKKTDKIRCIRCSSGFVWDSVCTVLSYEPRTPTFPLTAEPMISVKTWTLFKARKRFYCLEIFIGIFADFYESALISILFSESIKPFHNKVCRFLKIPRSRILRTSALEPLLHIRTVLYFFRGP